MAAQWKRHDFGWLRADGEVFLERGAVLTDTGHVHRGDEGWFDEAKRAAEHHVAQRDARQVAAS